MPRYFIGIKGTKAVVSIADDIDDAFRVCGKSLGIEAQDAGNIDLDVCVPIRIGVPIDISKAAVFNEKDEP